MVARSPIDARISRRAQYPSLHSAIIEARNLGYDAIPFGRRTMGA